MEDLLIILVQAFFELFFDLFLNAIIYFGDDLLGTEESWFDVFRHPVWGCILHFILGCILGWASLLVIHQHLIALPALRMANLAYGPVVCALLAYIVAKIREHKHPQQHAFYALFFTFGLVVVRFAYAQN